MSTGLSIVPMSQEQGLAIRWSIPMWDGPILDYTRYLHAADRSPGTIRLHRHYLRAAADEIRTHPWHVTTEQLVEWFAAHRWAPETRRSALSSLRGFYRWAALMGHCDSDPTLRLPRVKVPAGRPRPTPENVVAAALRRADRRGRLMLLLAAYGGLRCCEIAPIHSRDLDGAGLLRVVGKGRKVRLVPIANREVLDAIRRADGWLFPNGRGSHLTRGHVSVLLSRMLPDGWTGHTLRHRMATRAYAGTHDLLAVGAILGHSKAETTQRYVQLPMDSLWAAVAAAA